MSARSSDIYRYVDALEAIVLYTDGRLTMSRDKFIERLPEDVREVYLEVMAYWDDVNAKRLAAQEAERAHTDGRERAR
jgi:hypothetical protein